MKIIYAPDFLRYLISPLLGCEVFIILIYVDKEAGAVWK